MSSATVTKLPVARYEAGQPSRYHANPPNSRSPDAEYSIAGRTLRDWARHLADNSSIVTAILSSRVTDAIGTGLTYEPLVRDRKGKLLDDLNDKLRKIHTDWSRAPDVTGEYSRQELERLAWRTWDLDGECFIRRVIRRRLTNKRALPYQLQILDADWIPHNLTQDRNGELIVHGIQKDEWGAPIRYYIETVTKFDIYTAAGTALDPARMTKIDAQDMTHLKRVQRPNQTRGVTLLHPVIFRISDIAEYQESHRLAARASSDLFAAINRSPDMTLADDSDEKRSWDFEHLQMLDELQPGETVNFNTPQHPNQNAVDFVREELRAIASGCDVGFSPIAQVFDNSYSAQRMENSYTWRKIERDRSRFIQDFARTALYERVIETARLAGLLPARMLRKADPETLLDVRIDGPTMPVIDPVKDRNAFELDQINGWDSRHGIIRRMGRNPQDVDAERESTGDNEEEEETEDDEDDENNEGEA